MKTKLKIKVVQEKAVLSREAYNKQRRYCVNFLRESKTKYFGNLDGKVITENKTFWKAVGANVSC